MNSKDLLLCCVHIILMFDMILIYLIMQNANDTGLPTKNGTFKTIVKIFVQNYQKYLRLWNNVILFRFGLGYNKEETVNLQVKVFIEFIVSYKFNF